jgi:hypothetical protein
VPGELNYHPPLIPINLLKTNSARNAPFADLAVPMYKMMYKKFHRFFFAFRNANGDKGRSQRE